MNGRLIKVRGMATLASLPRVASIMICLPSNLYSIVSMGMQLNYHQATYDLLTQQVIDPQIAIENRAEAEQLRRKMITPDEAPNEFEKHLAKTREEVLHWTTLPLYQHPPTVSQSNVEALNQVEERYGVPIPVAVREWYSLDIANAMMMAHGFGAQPIAEFAPMSIYANKWFVSPREDLWYFLYHEFIDQGGEPIVFQLGSDDPKVLARYRDTYLEVAPTFSEFIYLHFWDWYRGYTFPYTVSVRPIMQEQYYLDFEVLHSTYHELRGNTGVRFYDDLVTIKVYRDLEAGFPPAVWTRFKGGQFSSSSLPALRQALINLWGDQLPFRWIMAHGTRLSHYAEIKEMLATLKSEVAGG